MTRDADCKIDDGLGSQARNGGRADVLHAYRGLTVVRVAGARGGHSHTGWRNLRGVVFDLDDTLTTPEFKGEMWARMVEHVRAVLPDADGDELRRRVTAARDAHYAALLAGSMDLGAFWRTQLIKAVAPWGQLPDATISMCVCEREANLERRRLMSARESSLTRCEQHACAWAC